MMPSPVPCPADEDVERPGSNPRSSVPYVVPFAVFMLLLVVANQLQLDRAWEYALRIAILSAVLWFVSRRVIDLRVRSGIGSVLLGIAVFGIWIGPDLLFPGYRSHPLFQNSVTGELASSIPAAARMDTAVLVFRALRAIILVPIIEELFWRAWMMRWLIRPDFWTVRLGTYAFQSMAITAVLFASEHGPYWDVGLAAGLLYNGWMIRTKSLGDCILAHAVTNACLSAYVVLSGRWEYWL